MSNRKETPDVLGEILSAAPVTTAPPPAPAKPTPAPADRSKTAKRQTSGGAKSSRVRRSARPMQWEYMSVRFRDYRGWRPRSVNDDELPGWKEGPEILEYLNQLGAEGWEMVGVVSRGRSERDAYFKRPKG